MERKIDPFSQFSLLTKIWMPLTWAISYTINLLRLWFHFILEINLFLSFHIPIVPKIFNYKRVFHYVSIDHLKNKPPDCSCFNSPFKYSPVVHVITGNLSTIDNENHRKIFAKGPKYRELQSINWKYNLKPLKILWRAMPEYGQTRKREGCCPFIMGQSC